ncbi:MAG: hypothetical protein JW384_02419 [Nitrosomonadaceae bacterium]|nr:hypothetical protein [Nitrosomonadaceae bacterium]
MMDICRECVDVGLGCFGGSDLNGVVERAGDVGQVRLLEF